MKLKWKNRHYFNAPDENKSSLFCKCGKYLTDKIHVRANSDYKLTKSADYKRL